MIMSKNTKKLAVGALIGAAAGYVAGVLTAPKSGKETRSDIKHAAQRAKVETEKALKAAHSELDELLASAKTQAGKLGKRAKHDFDNAVNAAKNAKEKARLMLSTLHEGGAEDAELKAALKDAKKATAHLKNFITKK